MKKKLTLNAIVLKRINYGDAAKILTIYSESRGKISVIAKGVRRMKSRSGSAIELFNHIQIEVAEGKNMYTLTGVSKRYKNADFSYNLESMSCAYVASELMDKLQKEEIPNEVIFQLFLQFITLLENGKRPFLLLESFMIKILTILGYLPDFSRCVLCNTKHTSESKIVWSRDAEGCVCKSCQAKTIEGQLELQYIHFRNIKLLNFLQKGSFKDITSIQVEKKDILWVKEMNRLFLSQHLEKDLKGLEVQKIMLSSVYL